MEDSTSHSYMHATQFGADGAHANPSQLQHNHEQAGSSVYDSAHHGSYNYNNLPPGYGHGAPPHASMGMYYHPSVYSTFPSAGMLNPASMSTGQHSSSGAGSGAAGSHGASTASGATQGAGTAADAPGAAGNQHYMHHYGHPHFFQPGVMPGMMGHQTSGHGFPANMQHPSQHGQQTHHAASVQVPGANYFPGAAGQATSSKKSAAKAGRPRKKKEVGAIPGVIDPAAAAAAASAAAAAAAGSMASVPLIAQAGHVGPSAIPGIHFDSQKKKEEPKKPEPKKPIRSHLKQPKQAQSAWQIYFTEELNRIREEKEKEAKQAEAEGQPQVQQPRLNVAHVAKGASDRYKALPDSEKAKYQQRSQELKAQWEKDMQAWKESLSPEDIKMENVYRTQQRKAGKSRKSNLKDPHAPKKPLSAYFLFLRAIRASAKMTEDVFGKESETTKQSVLAATKWRQLDEDEKRPYLAKAEQDKLRYEEARRVYEAAMSRGVPPAQAAAEATAAGRAAADKMAANNPELHNLPSVLRLEHERGDEDDHENDEATQQLKEMTNVDDEDKKMRK